MNRYLIIKPDCQLYEDYFAWQADLPKVNRAYGVIKKKFGIETNQYYTEKAFLHIIPTANDSAKFYDSFIRGREPGAFKARSVQSKMWREMTKDLHVECPQLINYCFSALFGRTWEEKIFHRGEMLYCAIESKDKVAVPDFAVEISEQDYKEIRENIEHEWMER